MAIHFRACHPGALAHKLGMIPMFLSEGNPDTAAEQLDAGYRHGGGWNPIKGFKMLPSGAIKYPGDPALPLLAEAILRDETIRVYDCSWVAIVQKNGDFEVARMD